MTGLRVVGWMDRDGFLWDEKSHAAEYFAGERKDGRITGVISLPAVVEALSDALAGSPVIRHRNLLKLLHELRALKESA